MILYTLNGAYVAALRPTYGDIVVTTTLRGKVAALDPVADYDGAVRRALTLAGRERGAPVKVLPMTLIEAVTFCGISFEEFMADISDEELRERSIAVCVPALDSPDPRVRADAAEVLANLGVTKQ